MTAGRCPGIAGTTPGRADPNRKIKAGTMIIQCPAEKGKEKIEMKKIFDYIVETEIQSIDITEFCNEDSKEIDMEQLSTEIIKTYRHFDETKPIIDLRKMEQLER